ncbi:hypothetical protein J8273_4431 [Carpediemonas membranifera]|uniref:Uncharacterized protein n=1 Tax=Carpediemonas membranifera TaxID=201153 RepID=A0A8J6B228_9EUKA|nr:hypothetical protein J8273_4431 [Carpediemonas membranifera]|eukprot:KAG9394068.1 hypothetical protein J8273_4431 [Carpediemonas membranifera]
MLKYGRQPPPQMPSLASRLSRTMPNAPRVRSHSASVPAMARTMKAKPLSALESTGRELFVHEPTFTTKNATTVNRTRPKSQGQARRTPMTQTMSAKRTLPRPQTTGVATRTEHLSTTLSKSAAAEPIVARHKKRSASAPRSKYTAYTHAPTRFELTPFPSTKHVGEPDENSALFASDTERFSPNRAWPMDEDRNSRQKLREGKSARLAGHFSQMADWRAADQAEQAKRDEVRLNTVRRQKVRYMAALAELDQ